MPTRKPGAAQARDAAFERLYRTYAQDVYRYTLALLRNPADAEDVTQTTFMNAYRAFRRGERIEKPQNWLIKIAHNAARTKYARAQRRVQEVPLDDQVAELPVPDDSKPEVQEVLAALAELPFNQRAALVMRELEGRSYAEIAQTLNVSQSAVEALIFRARRSLRLSRNAIRGLTLIQLPSSLSSFFDGPGGVVAGGGAVVGGGLLLKAAAVVAVSAVAAGVGYKSVEASTTKNVPPARGEIHPFPIRIAAETGLVRAAHVAHRNAVRGRGAAPRGHAIAGDDSAPTAGSDPSGAAVGGGDGGGSAGAGSTASPVDTVSSTVASSPVQLPVKPPSTPPVQVPSVPVSTPSVPQVTTPAVTVTVPKLP